MDLRTVRVHASRCDTRDARQCAARMKEGIVEITRKRGKMASTPSPIPRDFLSDLQIASSSAAELANTPMVNVVARSI